MKSSTETLIKALEILAKDIVSDGVANAAIAEAAGRLAELEQQKAELVAQVGALREDNKKLKERNRKLDVDLLKALFYAPSSPVSAQKAQEIEVWYGKFKQVVLAKNSGELADQYANRVKAGEL